MSNIIIYSSKYGCAEKCAKLLSEKLQGETHLVNLKNTKEIDLSKYRKVIIGGSIYIGRIQREVSDFCSNRLSELKEKRVGLFICGMQQGEAISEEIEQNFPSELLEISEVTEHFGGEFIFDRMNFMERMIIKKISKVTSDTSKILDDKIDSFSKVMNIDK